MTQAPDIQQSVQQPTTVLDWRNPYSYMDRNALVAEINRAIAEETYDKAAKKNKGKPGRGKGSGRSAPKMDDADQQRHVIENYLAENNIPLYHTDADGNVWMLNIPVGSEHSTWRGKDSPSGIADPEYLSFVGHIEKDYMRAGDAMGEVGTYSIPMIPIPETTAIPEWAAAAAAFIPGVGPIIAAGIAAARAADLGGSEGDILKAAAGSYVGGEVGGWAGDAASAAGAGAVLSGAAQGAASGFTSTGIQTGSLSEALESGAVGGVTGGVTSGLLDYALGDQIDLAREYQAAAANGAVLDAADQAFVDHILGIVDAVQDQSTSPIDTMDVFNPDQTPATYQPTQDEIDQKIFEEEYSLGTPDPTSAGGVFVDQTGRIPPWELPVWVQDGLRNGTVLATGGYGGGVIYTDTSVPVTEEEGGGGSQAEAPAVTGAASGGTEADVYQPPEDYILEPVDLFPESEDWWRDLYPNATKPPPDRPPEEVYSDGSYGMWIWDDTLGDYVPEHSPEAGPAVGAEGAAAEETSTVEDVIDILTPPPEETTEEPTPSVVDEVVADSPTEGDVVDDVITDTGGVGDGTGTGDGSGSGEGTGEGDGKGASRAALLALMNRESTWVPPEEAQPLSGITPFDWETIFRTQEDAEKYMRFLDPSLPGTMALGEDLDLMDFSAGGFVSGNELEQLLARLGV